VKFVQHTCATAVAPAAAAGAPLQISKNITLAGVGHVTLLDDSPASELTGTNFLITEAGAEGLT
jgi:hypothetical protein